MYSASVHVWSDQKHQPEPEVASAGVATCPSPRPRSILCFACIKFARRLTSCICTIRKRKQLKLNTCCLVDCGVRLSRHRRESRTSTARLLVAAKCRIQSKWSIWQSIQRFSAASATARHRHRSHESDGAPTHLQAGDDAGQPRGFLQALHLLLDRPRELAQRAARRAGLSAN